MSTHFRPRQPTSAPPSPVRPSTARSTIRAITPSPPPCSSEALRLDFAISGTPNYGAADIPGKADVRPKSDGLHQTHLVGSSGSEEPYAKYIQTAENGTFTSSPMEGVTNGMDLKRGGGMLGRSSPVKRSGRSKSPKKASFWGTKRPYSTPTLSSPQEVPSHGQEEERQQDESDTDADCPDTPTPMTTSQKRAAYLPLGTPTLLSYPKRSSKPKDSSQNPQTPQMKSTPKTLSASKPHDEEPKEPKLMPHPYSHLKPSDFDDGLYGTSRVGMSTRALSDQPEYRHPGLHEPQPSSDYYDAYQRHDQQGDVYFAQDQGGEEALAYQSVPLPSQQAHHQEQHTFHTVPSPQYLQQPAQAQHLPRKPLPSTNVARNISISATSATSNISGGTATSRRSIFSTPGRDELERKKALVEVDEGPFARVVSVADLNASRRVISEASEGGVRERMGKKVDEGKEKSRGCGMGTGCVVM